MYETNTSQEDKDRINDYTKIVKRMFKDHKNNMEEMSKNIDKYL